MTQESIQPILDWISAHPTWSGIIIFLISLSESLAIVGLIVPGVVLMTAIGTMMGAGILPFYETLLWAILGAVAGDGISYWLGYHYHEHLRDFWPFRQFPALLDRGETFFKNHGGKSIVFGRFVGPVRPMIPVIAGMMDMTPKRFLFFNILSAIAWAPLYCLPGILIGISLGSLSPEIASRIGVLVLLLLLALWCIYEILFLIGSRIANGLLWCLDGLWNLAKHVPLLRFLLKTQQGTQQGQLAVFLLFVLSVALFSIVYYDVWHSSGVANWNEPVYHALRALYSEQWIHTMSLLTGMGDPWVLIPAVLVIGVWLLWCQRYKASFCWLATILGGFVATLLMKLQTAIPRPDGLIYFSEKFAFPSAHTATALLVFGMAAVYIKGRLSKKMKPLPFVIAGFLILLVSFSRLYLGLHWFTDILGGLAFGLAFLTAGTFLFRRIDHQWLPIRAILIPGLLTLTITYTYYLSYEYPKTKREYIRQWTTFEMNEAQWWSGLSNITELYRTGTFRHNATLFNVEWLGELSNIQQDLEKNGWTILPRLNLKSSLMLLSEKTDPLLFPVLPKFHHDRLPFIIVGKSLGDEKRIVLQLWQSDYLSYRHIPLWAGTIRLEEASHPVPFTTVYTEEMDQNNVLTELKHHLKGKVAQHLINTKDKQQILLLKSS